MELILERGLEHQQKAVAALSKALHGTRIAKPHLAYENPAINVNDTVIEDNIRTLQKQNNIYPDFRGCRDNGNYLNLDIKMETGTGKTYVYTETIYELHL